MTLIRAFRKIRQNLLSKGKTGSYLKYALGEIILVVLGILIALQINNWNEGRKEAQVEQKYLKELKSDFTYNQEELERNISKASQLLSNCDGLLVLFGKPIETVDASEFLSYARRVGAYTTYNPSDGALENLISSGNLSLIKNDSLRMHLARWSGIIEDVKEDEKRLISFGDTQMNPFRLEYIDSNSDLTTLPPGLIESLKFKNTIKTIRLSADYNIENYGIISVEISKILEKINEELSSK